MGPNIQKILEFDTSLYRTRAVQKAAYKFGDRLHFHMHTCGADGVEPRRLRITLSLRQDGDLDFLAGEFCNEVLDQELREVVAEETRPLRDILMAQAFSAAALLDAEGDEGDYRQDPKGIRLHGSAASGKRGMSLGNTEYTLLPFQFGRLNTHTNDRRYLLTNFVGEYVVLDRQTLDDFARHRLPAASRAYRALKSRHFLLDAGSEVAIDLLAAKYRTKKAFLADSTSLFMFVTTLRCDHRCTYCQVSRRAKDAAGCDMSRETARRAVDFMFRCPSPHIKVEFQGGESLLNFDIVRYIVELVERRNGEEQRDVAFVLTTNLSAVTRDALSFCAEHGVDISTSLDGPRDLHNASRPCAEGDSYEQAVRGIKAAQDVLGPHRVAALMTATRSSLEHGREIVNEYLQRGFTSIFLRMINPYGYAHNAGDNGSHAYTVDEWLNFYIDTLDYIMQLAAEGVDFREEFTQLIVRKILSPYATGFVDLQSPAGIGISAIVFNYDGDVYCSDEGRMLAEMGDRRFRMGNVLHDSREDIMLDERFVATVEQTMAECVPDCSDCVFRPFCGSDPVRHYRTQGDIVGFKPTSDFCRKNAGVIRHLTTLLEDDPRASEVLKSWV